MADGCQPLRCDGDRHEHAGGGPDVADPLGDGVEGVGDGHLEAAERGHYAGEDHHQVGDTQGGEQVVEDITHLP